MNTHFGLALIKSFTGFENKGHAVPTRRIHVQANARKGWRVGILVFNRWIVRIALVLSKHNVLEFNRRHCIQDGHLGVTNVLSGSRAFERGWSLHGQEGENLQEMVLENVSNDTKLVKVSASALRSKGLFKGKQDALNVLAIPD